MSGFVATLPQSDVMFSTERPLHPCERILEQVLEWSTLESPSSAFLVIKKFPWTKRIQDDKGKVLTHPKDTPQLSIFIAFYYNYEVFGEKCVVF